MFPHDSPTHLSVEDTAGPFRLERLWYVVSLGVLGFFLSRGGAGAFFQAQTDSTVARWIPLAVAVAVGAGLAVWSPLGYDPVNALGVLMEHARAPRRAVFRPCPAYTPAAREVAQEERTPEW